MSVVVPLFNERDCLDQMFEMLLDLSSRLAHNFQFEFLLVDDGSTDGTLGMLYDRIEGRDGFRVIKHSRNQGIAAAIHTGICAASHERVASIDADGTYDPFLIAEMTPLLTEDVTMVTASPYHPDGAVQGVAPWRIWLSKAASRMYRTVTGRKLYCATSCFRLYRRNAVVGLTLNNSGFVGVAELAWRVHQAGGRIVEQPAVLKVRTAGNSKMKILPAARGHLRLMGQILKQRVSRTHPSESNAAKVHSQ